MPVEFEWLCVQDLRESIKRYYTNNFTDGFKQDAVDLFLGNYRVHANEGVCMHSLHQTQCFVSFDLLCDVSTYFIASLPLVDMDDGQCYKEHCVMRMNSEMSIQAMLINHIVQPSKLRLCYWQFKRIRIIPRNDMCISKHCFLSSHPYLLPLD